VRCYLKKYTVGILGNSVMLAEMLLESGIENIHLVSKPVSIEDVRKDPVLTRHEVGRTLNAMNFRDPEKVEVYEDLLEGSKCCDVLVDCGFGIEGAKIARRLGIPYITEPEVSVLLPEGVQYEELKFSEAKTPEEYYVVRVLQNAETLKCLRGRPLPVLSPEALKFDVRSGEIKRVSLI